MSLFQAVILALVHGITEFLPVSSSAHLSLAPWLLGWPDGVLSFDLALHAGSLLALLVCFARDWVQLLAQAVGANYAPDPDLRLNRTLLWFLMLATVPIGVGGLYFKKATETTLRDPVIVGFMLVSVALFLVFAERQGRRDRTLRSVTRLDAMLIGLSQALAIVPGTSRTGVTIATGILRGLDRHSAGRFSFLLSMPAMAIAAGTSAYDLQKVGGIPREMMGPFVAGMLVSAGTGAICIFLFLRFLRNHTLRIFVYYRIVLGLVIIVLALLVRP